MQERFVLPDWKTLASADDAGLPLFGTALLIARDEYPQLDPGLYDQLAQDHADALREEIEAIELPPLKMHAINRHLFEELGYTGNTAEYYDPRNSYLNEVIDRKTGIPITLSILYMELGRRIGLPLEGVSFPGHFLVRLRLRGGTLVLDPFAGGLPQSEVELRARLQRVVPRGAGEGAAVAALPLEQFLEPAGKRQILGRLLRNLKGIYRETDNPERLLQVLNRMLLVAPDAHAELRDRGYVYQRLECWRPALQDLTAYLEREPEAPDVDDVRARLVELSARCARLN